MFRTILRAIRRLLHMETTEALLFRRYQVDLTFFNGLAGGTPVTPNLAASHVARFREGVTNELKLSKKVEGEVSEEAAERYMMSVSSVFPLDDQGIYLRGHQINAMLKDSAQLMKATVKHKGLSRTIRDGGLIFPDRIYLNREPEVIEKPVKPDNGPANIKIFQVVHGVALSVPCAVLDNGDLPDTLFRQMWAVAQNVGLGACRHMGYGRFKVEVVERGHFEVEELAALSAGTLEAASAPVSNGSQRRRVRP